MNVPSPVRAAFLQRTQSPNVVAARQQAATGGKPSMPAQPTMPPGMEPDDAEAIAPSDPRPMGGPAEVDQLAAIRDDLPSPEELAREHVQTGASNVAPATERQLGLPPWLNGVMRFSPTNYYGSPWPDGKQHLIPERAYVAHVEATLQGVKDLIQSREGMEWYKVWQHRLEHPEHDLRDLYVRTTGHLEEIQRDMVDRAYFWTSYSFGLENAMTFAMGRFALMICELQEITESIARSPQPSERLLQRRDTVDAMYNEARDKAMFQTCIWIDSRTIERSLVADQATSIVDGGTPSSQAPPGRPISTDPDSVNLSYSILDQCIRKARSQEAYMLSNPHNQQRQAAAATSLEHIALY